MAGQFLDSLSLEDLLDDEEKEAIKTSVTKSASLSEVENMNFLGSKTYRQNRIQEETFVGNVFEKEQSDVAKVFGLQSKYSFSGYSHNSIEHTDTDKDIFNDTVTYSPKMQDTLRDGALISPTFQYLYEDLFFALFKYDATLKEATKIHFSCKANYEIISNLIHTPEFITLRKTARNSVFNAAYGCELLGENLVEAMKQLMQNVPQNQLQALQQLIDHEQQLQLKQLEVQTQQDTIENMIMTGDTDSEEFENAISTRDMMISDLNMMYADEQQLASGCDMITDPTDDKLIRMENVVSQDITNTTFQVKENSDMLGAWGLEDTGTAIAMGLEGKRRLLEAIRKSNKLKKLTDMIGKFRDVASTEQKKKSKTGKTDIESVTNGNRIEDLLPSEKMNLVMPQTRAMFYKNVTENKALVYKKTGIVSKDKGPIIAMIDTSGSIGDDEEMWQKALSCAMIEIAQLQKRDYACIIYSHHADKPIIISKDEVAPDKIIKIAETYHGGGTSFECPLNEALKLIETSQFKKADMVMLTDGESDISDEFMRRFNKLKEEKDFSVHGILVNIGGGGRTSTKSLDRFCDEVSKITDVAELTDPDSNVVKTLFGKI